MVVDVVLVVVCYLIGTFPSAVMVARSRGVDITAEGSGNPGASNVARVLGRRLGALVFVLDAAKGALAAAIGLLAADGAWVYVFVGAALVGHMYPVTRRFRGGKGIATAAGALLVLFPILAVAAIALWFVVLKLTRKASVASIVATIAGLIGLSLLVDGWHEMVVILALGALVLARHAGNVRRLVSGREHSI
jgi:glycerol-3-phosphate acyltransferase PlsY